MRSSAFAAASSGACDHSGAAISGTDESTEIRGVRFISGCDDGGAGLDVNVLIRIPALDNLLVVERNSCLTTIGILAEDVYRFLLGEITESPSNGNCVQHRRGVGD